MDRVVPNSIRFGRVPPIRRCPVMKLLTLTVVAVAVSLLTCGTFAEDDPAAEPAGAKGPADAPAPAEPDRAALEKQFAQTMSGATLVGHFTVEGRGNGSPKEDRYTIQRVTKQSGDKWLF